MKTKKLIPYIGKNVEATIHLPQLTNSGEIKIQDYDYSTVKKIGVFKMSKIGGAFSVVSVGNFDNISKVVALRNSHIMDIKEVPK